MDPASGGDVRFTVKELLGKLDTKLDLVVTKLDEKVDRKSFDLLAAQVNKIETDIRLDKERVESARTALAAETERRRAEAEKERVERAEALEVAPRTWGVRAAKWAVVGVCASAVVALVAVLSLYLAHA
jgi:hypothetical protein